MKINLVSDFYFINKVLKIMKLTPILLYLSIFQVLALNINGQNAVIEMSSGRTSVGHLLNEIEKQTNYLVIYSNREVDIKREIYLAANKNTVVNYLKDAFSKTDIYPVFDSDYIVLSKKTAVQKSVVTGTVTDETGEPLGGVNIMLKGTGEGVITGIDGKYSITVPDDKAILAFSFIGFAPQEITVNGRKVIDVILREDTKFLDEVVVIGYGTSTVKKLTSAITTVKSEDLVKTPYANITQALQGRGAGIIVNNKGGQPGDVPELSIRGGGKPLYVINGVIKDDIAFNNLNPEDIESISFLKDAASTSVYGSQAGDGIVLVTTKKGKKDKGISAEYSFMQQFSQPTKLADRVNSWDYVNAFNQACDYDQVERTFSDEVLQKVKDQSDPYNYANVDWTKVALKKFAPEQKHNLAINGAGKRTSYYVGIGYFNQGSLYKANTIDVNRYNLRTNVDTDFEEIGLNLNLDVNATLEDNKFPSTDNGGLWGHINRRPLDNPYNPDGTYAGYGDHLLAELDSRSGYNKTRRKMIDVQLSAQWKIPFVKGLEVGALANYTENDKFTKRWRKFAPQYSKDGELFVPGAAKPSLSQGTEWSKNTYLEANIAYAKTFGKHTIESKFLAMRTENYREELSASRRDFLSGQIDQMFAGPNQGKDNDGKAYESASMGFVGRLKYDYASKYILEGNFRYDGSDNFADGHRWGFFPSGSAAWIISEEPFMETLRDNNILNYMKLRGSIGQTGLTSGLERFDYMFTYDLNSNVYVFDNAYATGFSEGALVNPEVLSWYEQNSYNLGVDFSTLRNKLTATFEYFYIRTTGYLQNPKGRYYTPLGKDLPKINSNSAHRRAGFEIDLQYRDRVGDFHYNVGFNLTKYDQLWERLATEDMVNLQNPMTRETHQKDNLGRIFFDNGLYQNAQQILDTPRFLASTETRPGDISYQDINGDGKIDDADRVRYGKPSFPHVMYGINFGADYKGWFLSGLIQGTGDRYVTIEGDGYLGVYAGTIFNYQLDYWRPDNTDARYPRHSTDYQVNGQNNKKKSTFNTWNTKYIRLKNLNIGYDLKHTVLKKVDFISSLRVALSGTNLLTFSKVFKFIDPEDYTFNGSYPVQRVYAINVSVGF